MSLQQSAPNSSAPRALRAAVLDRLLEEERWTSRKAATALGLTHTYVGRRRNGEQDLTFEDIELFASLLKLTPEALFAELRAAEGTNDPIPSAARASGGAGGTRSIYFLDSVGPARFELTTSTVESERFTVDHVADVIPLFRTTEPEAVNA